MSAPVVTATGADGRIELAWTAADAGVRAYEVRRKTLWSSTLLAAVPANTLAYVDSVPNGTSHTYRIRAIYAGHTVTSNEATATATAPGAGGTLLFDNTVDPAAAVTTLIARGADLSVPGEVVLPMPQAVATGNDFAFAGSSAQSASGGSDAGPAATSTSGDASVESYATSTTGNAIAGPHAISTGGNATAGPSAQSQSGGADAKASATSASSTADAGPYAQATAGSAYVGASANSQTGTADASSEARVNGAGGEATSGLSAYRNGTTLSVALRVGTNGVRHLNVAGLPTSNPAVAGDLWNDSGTLKISAG